MGLEVKVTDNMHFSVYTNQCTDHLVLSSLLLDEDVMQQTKY